MACQSNQSGRTADAVRLGLRENLILLPGDVVVETNGAET